MLKNLRQTAGELAGRKSIEEVCKIQGISIPTYHQWQMEHGGVKKEAVKRLKDLEKENTRLKYGGG